MGVTESEAGNFEMGRRMEMDRAVRRLGVEMTRYVCTSIARVMRFAPSLYWPWRPRCPRGCRTGNWLAVD